jgi:pantoate--beta-alanine ligase
MIALHSPQIVQETVLRWKKDGKKVAFVPTMGALHAGHLALVEAAKSLAPKVIVSIFVNPLQFAQGEDLSKYPRTLETDSDLLDKLDVDVLFAPTEKEFFAEDFVTQVRVGKLTEHLCGKFRPGHFEGVATVCLKLFQITQADFAVFGEKDFQQLRVIQQMTSDLNMPLSVVPYPTVREADGLARSSRNVYLSLDERALAARIPQATKAANDAYRAHPNANVGSVLAAAAAALETQGVRIEYLEIASEKDLVPCDKAQAMKDIFLPRLFLAARIGNTRLIDNTALDLRIEIA